MAIVSSLIFFAAILLGSANQAWAVDMIYHLHQEPSATNTKSLSQLKTALPDYTNASTNNAVTYKSANLKGALGEKIIRAFDTQVNDPKKSGTLPAGSTMTYTLWMKKSGNYGEIVPQAKLLLNSASGVPICTMPTGQGALTTNLQSYVFSCTVPTTVTMTTSDRFYLWVGVNIKTKSTQNVIAELNVEGTVNGSSNSRVAIPYVCDPDSGDMDTVVSKILVFSFNPILTNDVVTRPALDPTQNPLKACQAADPSIYEDVIKPGDVSKLPFRLNEYLCVNGYPPILSRSGKKITRDFFDRVSNASRGKDANGCPRIKYQIVDVVEADAWPVYSDGFQYNNESFVAESTLKGGSFFSTSSFYGKEGKTNLSDVQFFKMANLDRRVMDGEIDEVLFINSLPDDVAWESWMVGEGAFNINQTSESMARIAAATSSTRAYPIHYGCFQCFNHRVEFTMLKMFGTWNGLTGWNEPDFNSTVFELPAHAWDRFTRIDRYQSGAGNIGNAHRPFNARCEYDFKDGTNCNPPVPLAEGGALCDPTKVPLTAPVATNAEDWYNYPKMTGSPNLIQYAGSSVWGCDENFWDAIAPHDGYALWFMQHLPRAGGINDGAGPFDKKPADVGMLNNWWRYLFDVEQFKSSVSTLGGGRLVADSLPPTVTIQSPSFGSTVRGKVAIKVDARDANPIYRVDLYVDGVKYIVKDPITNNVIPGTGPDTLKPYIFMWDTKNVSPGSHKLVAKAYDMPNGLEGVSAEVTVNVVAASPPTLTKIGPKSVIAGTALNFTLTASDPDVPLNYSVTQAEYFPYLPAGATLTCANSDCSTANFSWTPSVDQRGAQWIRFVVTDYKGDQAWEDVVISIRTPLTDIDMFSPTSGPPVNTRVIIVGTNLTGTSRVTFNGVAAATYQSVGDSIAFAFVPAGATTGPICITTPGGTGCSTSAFVVVP